MTYVILVTLNLDFRTLDSSDIFLGEGIGESIDVNDIF